MYEKDLGDGRGPSAADLDGVNRPAAFRFDVKYEYEYEYEYEFEFECVFEWVAS